MLIGLPGMTPWLCWCLILAMYHFVKTPLQILSLIMRGLEHVRDHPEMFHLSVASRAALSEECPILPSASLPEEVFF